jgi:hypothetical protein
MKYKVEIGERKEARESIEVDRERERERERERKVKLG